MKLAIITDTHAGCRNDNKFLLHKQKQFYESIFFPVCEEYGITTVLHLGDIFDRRKNIQFGTFSEYKNFFFDILKEKGMIMHSILGNHDTFLSNTNMINSPSLLLREYDNIYVYEHSVKTLTFDKLTVDMCPWITRENSEKLLSYLSKSKSDILMGHFNLKGFEMMKGVLCDHGLDHKLFSHYESVYSGHFHHASTYGNIKYLGAPYEMNWSDVEGKKGFHILDTETRDLEFVENIIYSHKKIVYDDEGFDINDLASFEYDEVSGVFLKIVVQNKTNPQLFDMFIKNLEQANPADLKIIDTILDSYIGDSSLKIEEEGNPRQFLERYVNELELEAERKQKVISKLNELYMESLNAHEI